MPSLIPVNKLGSMCGNTTEARIWRRLAPMDLALVSKNWLDILYACRDRHDDWKHSMAHTECDLRCSADSENNHKQGEHSHERHPVEQEDDG